VVAHTLTALLLKNTMLLKTNALKNNSDIVNQPTELGFWEHALNANNVVDKEKLALDGKKD